MKETGLLFKPDMIKAILEGRKTMTRRVIKNPEKYSRIYECAFCCPFGKAGDLLYVKETFQHMPELTKKYPERYVYRADNFGRDSDKWKSPLFMPKAAARIWLEITDIKVERLQDIDEVDAKAEGAERMCLDDLGQTFKSYGVGFRSIWHSINGEESWNANPFVWAISFKKIEAF